MKKLIYFLLSFIVAFNAESQTTKTFGQLPGTSSVATSDSVLIHRSPGGYYRTSLSRFLVPDNLGTGTASSLKVLYGDGVWRIPMSLSSLSATSPLSYNSGTGVFSIPLATTSQNGYLSSIDWNTFNAKVPITTTVNGHALSSNVTVAPSDLTTDATHRFVTDGQITTWNASALDANVVHNTGNETVAGVKTFSSSPSVPTPSGTNDAVNKSYVDAANPYPALSEVGTIITETWANLTSWTSVGTGTFSVASNQLTVNGGTPGTIQVGNYIRNSGYGNTNYLYHTSTFNITVGTINSTSWGVGFGLQSQSTGSTVSAIFGIMLDATNKGNIFLFANGSNTVIDQTKKGISVSAGDVLSVKLVRTRNQFVCTLVNTTASQQPTITLEIDASDYTTSVSANVSQFSIYALGGTDHKVTSSLVVTSNHKTQIDLLCVGDSRTTGSGVYVNNSFMYILSSLLRGTVDAYAAPGDKIEELTVSEILAIAPKKIFVMAGTNNRGFGDNDATTTTKFQTLINSLVSGGYVLGTTLFYSDELPRGAVDMSTLSSSYKTTIGLTGCVQTFNSFLASSGTGADPLYMLADGLHPNEYGHQKLAMIIGNAIPFTKANLSFTSYNTIRKGYFGNKYLGNNFALEATNQSGVSQIHFANGSSTYGGGHLFSNSDNQAVVYGGAYVTNSIVTAAATSGSAVAQNIGNINFQTFSGATVGSTATPTVRGTFLNAGGFASGSTASVTYRNTNAGSDVTSHWVIDPASSLTSGVAYTFDATNGFGFTTGNGTRRIQFAAIKPVATNSTAGSEAGDIAFYTQSSGAAATEKFRITSLGGLTVNNTVTATGTTGAQTINKASGTVNIAASGTSVVVTNSLVSTSSIVYAVIRTNDSTAQIKNVVPASGSFTINLSAATTAETSIGFFVIN